MCQEDEIWKPISQSAGYCVSSHGRVRNAKGDEVKQYKAASSRGWMVRAKSIDPKVRNYLRLYLHRLVATEFIPNPHNYKHVYHINGRTEDNRACNLRWTDNYEGAPETRIAVRPIRQVHQDGTTVDYPSLTAASKATGVKLSSISETARGFMKTAGGFQWKYIEEPSTIRPILTTITKQSPSSNVRQYMPTTEDSIDYSSIEEASATTGISNEELLEACNTGGLAGGYIWRFVQ